MSSVAAVSTTLETSSNANGLSHRSPSAPATLDGTTSTQTSTNANGGISAEEAKELRRAFQKKYRHVAAIHSKSQPSTLSHDAVAAPSFLGFRNLMVIVLGMPFVIASFL
jgi:diacylglycerol O-acyltransferase 1